MGVDLETCQFLSFFVCIECLCLVCNGFYVCSLIFQIISYFSLIICNPLFLGSIYHWLKPTVHIIFKISFPSCRNLRWMHVVYILPIYTFQMLCFFLESLSQDMDHAFYMSIIFLCLISFYDLDKILILDIFIECEM